MSESEKVEIKKIILDLGDGHEITIPIEKAKKLKKALEELFGKEVIKEVREEHHHHHDNYKWWWDYKPYWGTYVRTNAIGQFTNELEGSVLPNVQFKINDQLNASFSAENKSLCLSLKD